MSPKFHTISVVLSLVLSVSALAVSCTQAISQKHYNSLAVRPHVVITPDIGGTGQKNGLYLSNDGLGPAMLKDIRIKVSGQEFGGFGSSPLSSALKAAGLNPLCFERSWPKKGAWLKVGEEYPFLAMTKASKPECILDVVRLLTTVEMNVEVDYEDLDEKTFQFTGDARINDADAIDVGRSLTR